MHNPLSSQELMESAVQSTDLADFGPIPFKDGLEALVGAINGEKDFFDNTLHYLRVKIQQILENRLQVEALVKRNPEILEEKIIAPIIITGLPRTGTTILQTLMALDPACRFLRNWETAMNICPPPKLLHSVTDPRIQEFHQTIEGLLQMAPALRPINGLNFMAGGTAECQNLMAHAFRSFEYCAGFGLSAYGEWLLSCDMRPGYQTHKLLLQILQWQCPNEYWVLKAPMHLISLDSLMNMYPDARIVFTHRDPFTTMISGSSLVYNWSVLASANPDKRHIGKWFPRLWEEALFNSLEDRNKWPQAQLFDLHFEKLVSDPVEAVNSIYEHFGLALSHGHRIRMAAWLRDNPKTSLGVHSYAAEDFGMIRDDEDCRFSVYKQRFSV
jgi:hypothetical protein